MNKLTELLDRKDFVFLDGGMGTMLQALGIETEHVPEMLNLTDPESIMKIHRMYAESGSDIVYANTFGANRFKLCRCGHSVEEIVSAGVKNAREAVGGKALIALDIGPLGQLLEPSGSLSLEEAYDCFREIVLAGPRYPRISVRAAIRPVQVPALL